MTPRDWTTAEAALDEALACARGRYQRDLLSGRAALSGADLRGTARRYGGRYAASRSAVLGRVEDAGVAVAEVSTRTGRRVLVYGDAACRIAAWTSIVACWAGWPAVRGSTARRLGEIALAAERASLRGDERRARTIAAVAVRALRRLDREHDAWLRPVEAIRRLAA